MLGLRTRSAQAKVTAAPGFGDQEGKKEDLPLDAHPQRPAATGDEGPEGSGIGKGRRGQNWGRWLKRSSTSSVQPGCTSAREMPREGFKRELENELTGRETEPNEISYFRI